MKECTHKWTVTSECPFCLRMELNQLQAELGKPNQEIERLRLGKKADETQIELLREERMELLAELDDALEGKCDWVVRYRNAQTEIAQLKDEVTQLRSERHTLVLQSNEKLNAAVFEHGRLKEIIFGLNAKHGEMKAAVRAAVED